MVFPLVVYFWWGLHPSSLPVIMANLILSEEISLNTGKEWAYMGNLLLLTHWSGNARSGWPSPVKWVMQDTLTLSSLKIPNKYAFFVQSFKVFWLSLEVLPGFIDLLCKECGKLNPCHLFLPKTLVSIIEENFWSRYKIMATVCYFTTLKMSLHCILTSIASDEKISCY